MAFTIYKDRHIMQRHNYCDVNMRSCMTPYSREKSFTLKNVKKKIQIFVMNMLFISSSDARKKFISFVASSLMKNTFFASLDEMNVIFIPKI